MMFKLELKIIYYTLVSIIKNNPIKIIFMALSIFSFYMKEYVVDTYYNDIIKITDTIIKKNGKGEITEYIYISYDKKNYNIIYKTKPIEIIDGMYTHEEFTGWVIMFNVLFYISVFVSPISFVMSLFEYDDITNDIDDTDRSSWDVISNYKYIKRKILIKSITKKSDLDVVYFIINKKIVWEMRSTDINFKSPFRITTSDLSRMYDSYENNYNILDDFKGTLSERRDEDIDKILNTEGIS